MNIHLIIPAFIAGIITFFAPCTFPLVPGYLGFISGASIQDMQDPKKRRQIRLHIFVNGLLYVLGFSIVFILLGTLFGIGGAALVKYRILLGRIGGLFVIFFGLYMMHVFKLPSLKFLEKDTRLKAGKWLKPGHPLSSFLFGATFAFGWSPCIGPILGSILLLVSASSTAAQGAFLLFIFSLGLGIPFLIIAALIGSVGKYIHRLNTYLHAISLIGGIFLVVLGFLLVTNNFGEWIKWFYDIFGFFNIESRLIKYL